MFIRNVINYLETTERKRFNMLYALKDGIMKYLSNDEALLTEALSVFVRRIYINETVLRNTRENLVCLTTAL